MMNHRKTENHLTDQESLIEETLNSLSGLSHAKTDPFFFTRLEARMAGTERKATVFDLISGWMAPVQAAFYTVLLLFVLNTVSVIYYNSATDTENSELEAFAEEYGLYAGEELYESLLEEE